MSHFVVMVIGNDVEEQLARYDESIEVEKYSQGLVSNKEKDRMMSFYKKKGEFKDFDDCYAQFGEDWNNNRWVKNENGEYERFTTYNPDSKWDWYQIGGRWTGMLRLKDGAEPIRPLNFGWMWNENEKDEMRKKNIADVAYKRDIANLSEIVPFAIVKDGEWYERGKMGWFGVAINEMDKLDWEEQVKLIVDSVADNELITMVDCHI